MSCASQDSSQWSTPAAGATISSATSEVGVAAKNLTCKRDAGSLATAGQKIFAQFDQALGTSGGIAAPIARKQRAAALGNGLQQFPEERGVHLGPMATPIR